MDSFVAASIYIIGALTAITQLLLIIFILCTLLSASWREWLHERLGTHGALLGLTFVGASILGSLFFSEVAGLPACFLCIIERFLMYPQILLFGWYLYGRGAGRTHRGFLYAALALSIVGVIVSGYHVLLENGFAREIVDCQVLGSGISCTIKYLELFGYLTIPIMSLTVFSALLLMSIVVLHRKHWLPQKAALYSKF